MHLCVQLESERDIDKSSVCQPVRSVLCSDEENKEGSIIIYTRFPANVSILLIIYNKNYVNLILPYKLRGLLEKNSTNLMTRQHTFLLIQLHHCKGWIMMHQHHDLSKPQHRICHSKSSSALQNIQLYIQLSFNFINLMDLMKNFSN